MHPRHRIDPDSWSIVMDYLCADTQTVIRQKLKMHDQLREISYVSCEMGPCYIFIFKAGIQVSQVSPRIVKAYLKKDKIYITDPKVFEICWMKKRLPGCLGIVAKNADSIISYYQEPPWCGLVRAIWNHSKIQLVARDGRVVREYSE